MTDDYSSYQGMAEVFEGGHHTINHSEGDYTRVEDGKPVIHTNTAESFFALLKRGHYGVYHKMSEKHLPRYCNEFSFRWKHRKVSDGHRMVAVIDNAEGKRLKYKGPVTRQS